MRRLFGLFFVLFLVASLSGCAAMGPLSPLGPVERAIVFAATRDVTQVTDVENDGADAWFTTSDGIKLHGRFFDQEQPRAVVLFCHGNAGSVAGWIEVARELHRRHQFAVLVFDYRGYGRSAGYPSEDGVFRDGRAARMWLAERTGIEESDVVLMGRSLGGAVAVDLATDGEARGLVLENTFSSLPDVAAVHLPWIVPHLNMTQRMNSAEKIARYQGPLLQSHGDADSLIPIALARKLHAAAPGRKEFVVIPGADHNDPAGEDYAKALDRFVDSLPAVVAVADGSANDLSDE